MVSVILETVDWLYFRYAAVFDAFNLFSVALFSVKYALRVWSCNVDERFRDPLRGRLQFVVAPLSLIDLMAVLPFYLPIIFPELRFLRAIRLLMQFRMLKLKKDELGVMLFFMLILLVATSSLMYQVEHDAQPEQFSSILATMWWGIETLATIGYGDVYPITPRES
jgi:voltage-gated potassium channel